MTCLLSVFVEYPFEGHAYFANNVYVDGLLRNLNLCADDGCEIVLHRSLKTNKNFRTEFQHHHLHDNWYVFDSLDDLDELLGSIELSTSDN
jgi:hypothetical protein